MGNVHMEATQINYREGNKKMSVAQAIKNAGSEITPEEKAWIDTIPELASQEIIAPEFDAEEGVYSVGDLVIYQGGLYKFTTAHETAGAWNPEEVAAVKVSEELSSLESGLNDVQNNLITLNANSIVRQGIGNKTSAITLTFAGKGHTRVANMVLMLANQAYVYPPIPIMFTGVDGPNMDITSVVVAANDLGVTTNDLSITIPSNLCGWGTHLLFKLFPNDNITVTVS